MAPSHNRTGHILRGTVAALALAAAAACGGGERGGADTSQQPAGGARPSGPGSVAAGPLTEASLTPQMVAFGDSIFTGQAAGGICFTCHGQEGQGSQIGPDLTDQQWLNGDGSLDFIVNTVRNGVPQPKQYAAPMPGFGQSLSEEQLRAVAAYVYSKSHPNVGRGG